MKMISLDAVSPHGVKMTITACAGKSEGLAVLRENSQSLFMDIVDQDAPPHLDGRPRVIAIVPSSWFLAPTYAEDEKEAPKLAIVPGNSAPN